MIELSKKSLAMAIGLGLSFVASSASAGGYYPPKEPTVYCHNIGGPRDKGANCDSNNQCTFELDNGQTITVSGNRFLGILIPPTSIPNENALAAHIAHGDGPVIATFDPPLHLASEIGPHIASNVECMGVRILPQPPEPGN